MIFWRRRRHVLQVIGDWRRRARSWSRIGSLRGHQRHGAGGAHACGANLRTALRVPTYQPVRVRLGPLAVRKTAVCVVRGRSGGAGGGGVVVGVGGAAVQQAVVRLDGGARDALGKAAGTVPGLDLGGVREAGDRFSGTFRVDGLAQGRTRQAQVGSDGGGDLRPGVVLRLKNLLEGLGQLGTVEGVPAGGWPLGHALEARSIVLRVGNSGNVGEIVLFSRGGWVAGETDSLLLLGLGLSRGRDGDDGRVDGLSRGPFSIVCCLWGRSCLRGIGRHAGRWWVVSLTCRRWTCCVDSGLQDLRMSADCVVWRGSQRDGGLLIMGWPPVSSWLSPVEMVDVKIIIKNRPRCCPGCASPMVEFTW